MKPGDQKASKTSSPWKYLERRPGSWRRQLYIKEKPFKALDIYEEILATGESHEEAAKAWNIPIEAVREIVDYCRQNKELLKSESHEDHRRIESIYRLSASTRTALKILLYALLTLLPIILVFTSRDWMLYAIWTLLFIIFLRYVKDLPVIGKFWISCFGDNTLFEWLKITVIPISVLFLGTSITNAINSRQSEANVEKSRYDVTQKYFEMFNPNNQSAQSIQDLKAKILALSSNKAQLEQQKYRLQHENKNYQLPSNCYRFRESTWLTNHTVLALNQLTGLQTNWSGKTAQKRHILEMIHKEDLIKVGKNVISLHLADLSNSNLVLADLKDSCLESVLFSDYAGTLRSHSDLRHAKLDGSDLTGANMRNANLRSASLRGVDLRGYASLRNSDLRGADLSAARIDQSTSLKGARINTKTINITGRKQSKLYGILCTSKIREYLRRTFYCVDNIDYKDLEATRLPKLCTPSGCRQISLAELQAKGVIIDNELPVE